MTWPCPSLSGRDAVAPQTCSTADARRLHQEEADAGDKGLSTVSLMAVGYQGMRGSFPRLPSWSVVTSRQTAVRLPEDLAADADAVARVKGTSVNSLIIESDRQ